MVAQIFLHLKLAEVTCSFWVRPWLIAEACALKSLLCNYTEIDVSTKVRGTRTLLLTEAATRGVL